MLVISYGYPGDKLPDTLTFAILVKSYACCSVGTLTCQSS